MSTVRIQKRFRNWKYLLMSQSSNVAEHLYCLYLHNSSSICADIFSFYLTLLGPSTVKILGIFIRTTQDIYGQ
jgi:hypothetical protein